MTRGALDEPGLEERLSAHNPMNRLGSTDELRGVALFLASNASSFVTGAEYVNLFRLKMKKSELLKPASLLTVDSAPGEG